MNRDNRTILYGKLALGGLALLAMIFAIPATPIAPIRDADARGKYWHYRRYRASVTKKKVKGRWEIKINYYSKYYRFNGGSYRLQHLTVYTKSDEVSDFISKKGTSQDLWKAVSAGASRFTCEDLLTGKRLVKLERSLANAISGYYKKKKKKAAGAMDVMIGMYAPYRAYCKPTKKKVTRRP